jgi:hypothetical protein
MEKTTQGGLNAKIGSPYSGLGWLNSLVFKKGITLM